MAEEEVLQEQVVPAKKEKGGGVKLIHLILICVVLVIVTAASTMMLNKGVGKVGEELSNKVNMISVKQSAQMSEASGMVSINECKESEGKDKIVPLQKDAIIVNMADKDHYISTKIALCVDGSKLTDEQFTARVPQFLTVISDVLSRTEFADFYGPGAEKPEAGMASVPAGGTNRDAFASKFARLQAALTERLHAETNGAVKEVYLNNFLIQ